MINPSIVVLGVLLALAVTTNAFRVNMARGMKLNRPSLTALKMSDPNNVPAVANEDLNAQAKEVIPADESEEDKYKREKLAEIADLQAKEVFVERDTGRWECQACGFVYAEKEGYEKRGIPAGTVFDVIEKFRCPQCGASKKYFIQETETVSGFKENLNYGFGGNSMTAGAKSNLIFGGLGLGFVLFLSGYLLE